MKDYMFEERLDRLEKILTERAHRKDELFGLEKAKATEEKDFLNKLFGKYRSLKDDLKSVETKAAASKAKGIFYITLVAKDKDLNGLTFVIATPKSHKDMYVRASDNDTKTIATLKPVNIKKDLDQIAKFLLERIEDAEEESKSKGKKKSKK